MDIPLAVCSLWDTCFQEGQNAVSHRFWHLGLRMMARACNDLHRGLGCLESFGQQVRFPFRLLEIGVA